MPHVIGPELIPLSLPTLLGYFLMAGRRSLLQTLLRRSLCNGFGAFRYFASVAASSKSDALKTLAVKNHCVATLGILYLCVIQSESK